MEEQLEIISLPHPALRQASQKVGFINEEIKALALKMIRQGILWEKDRPHETTVGLAAVQVNRPLKIIIIRADTESKSVAHFQILINPKITKRSGARTIQLEGCLSVPQYYVNVERCEEVKVTALDINANPFIIKATGFLARIVQHELDHLKGITIVDRATEGLNEQGEKITFCRLVKSGQFEKVPIKEIIQAGILKDD